VTVCPLSQIFALIEQRYKFQLASLKVEQSVAHILFLFLNHTELPEDGIKIMLASEHSKRWFNPYDNNGVWTYCSRNNDPYSMFTLMDEKMPQQLNGAINFPSSLYYNPLERAGRRNDQRGIDWFRAFAQLKDTPQLQARNSRIKKSLEFDYIIDQCSHRLLGVLKANWHQYQSSAMWDKAIKEVEVPILDSDEWTKLSETFLPVSRLKATTARLGLHGFGFLEELDELADNEASNWIFLEQFGVGTDTNVSFWLKALRHAAYDGSEHNVIFKIYSELQLFSGPDATAAIK
jgi:hypothetical protein